MDERELEKLIDTITKRVTAEVLAELRGDRPAPTSTCGEGAFECDGPRFECGEYARFECGNTFTCNHDFEG